MKKESQESEVQKTIGETIFLVIVMIVVMFIMMTFIVPRNPRPMFKVKSMDAFGVHQEIFNENSNE